jgi:hypothetical protein
MARTNSGSLDARTLTDGTRVFRLRFNADGRSPGRPQSLKVVVALEVFVPLFSAIVILIFL